MPRLIYIAADEQSGYIKIGSSGNVRSRIRSLEISHSCRLRLLATTPGSHPEEKILQLKFSEYLAFGREWFRDAAAIREFADDCASGKFIFPLSVEVEQSMESVVAVPRECFSKLKDASWETGIKMKVIVRQSLEDWLKKRIKKLSDVGQPK